MSVREQFEAWMRSSTLVNDWETWQAAYAAGRRAGLEEAAKVCDLIAEARPFVQTARDCAAAIRALC